MTRRQHPRQGSLEHTHVQGDDEDDIIARLAMSTAFEPGREVLGQAIEEFGAVPVVQDLCAARGASVGLAALQERWDSGDWLASARTERQLCADRGIGVSVPGQPSWPTQLDDLAERAPLALRIMGSANLRTAAARSVAMVGARSATQYGQWVAEDMSAQLAVLGWSVVSGGAFGIDAACHHGALTVGGVSIAVSAGGVDRAIPASHSALFERLYRGGVVVGEVPIGSHPNRHRFLIRNRVIAALSPAVVVVEAATRSGALSTAREALGMGRVVAAVPGPVTSAMSAGCHALLRDTDSILVTSADEVIALVMPAEQKWIGGKARELTFGQASLLDAVDASPREVGILAKLLLAGEQEVAADAFLLERWGLIKRVANGWVRDRTRHYRG
ncbi:MAG: DNA-protecting protein DprA [Actinobacteria bacterium]|nr:DNA-protecting protein DprA [Actinomycetota bacterium]